MSKFILGLLVGATAVVGYQDYLANTLDIEVCRNNGGLRYGTTAKNYRGEVTDVSICRDGRVIRKVLYVTK